MEVTWRSSLERVVFAILSCSSAIRASSAAISAFIVSMSASSSARTCPTSHKFLNIERQMLLIKMDDTFGIMDQQRQTEG